MTDRKMPNRTFYAESSPTVIDKIWFQWKKSSSSDYPWAENFVCGFPLPDFQRGLVWDQEVNTSFIESIWLGFDIGSYMLSDYGTDGNDGLLKYSDCVIDGQQRLNAIEKYWSDDFPVMGWRWSEITDVDKRVFRSIGFGHKLIRTLDEQFLRDTYNRLNFSGVNHSLSDMA
ncbi:DUF262 domain-containing protein [bacterium]|nr:DUF262 domain-containing protein [bacterium]